MVRYARARKMKRPGYEGAEVIEDVRCISQALGNSQGANLSRGHVT